jgi:hypothetical protein
MPRIPTLAVLTALAAAGCTGKADVRLRMENQTAANALVGGPDRTLGLKLIAVYLAEDVDPQSQNNVGKTQMIWLNPECNDQIDRCVPSGVPGDGPRVHAFFDFGLPTEEVNAALNSQGRAVEEGTYRYARIEFCKYGPPAEPNLMWSGPGMAAERAMIVGDCGRTSQVFDPPLAVGAGEAVTVTLGYDLAQSIQAGAPGPGGYSLAGVDRWFRDCEDLLDGTRVCMDFPDFVPSATKD